MNRVKEACSRCKDAAGCQTCRPNVVLPMIHRQPCTECETLAENEV